jgi:hypothetical protein
VLDQARDGSIILLHDGGISPENVMEVVNNVVRGVRERGLGFERLDRLIERIGNTGDTEKRGDERSGLHAKPME